MRNPSGGAPSDRRGRTARIVSIDEKPVRRCGLTWAARTQERLRCPSNWGPVRRWRLAGRTAPATSTCLSIDEKPVRRCAAAAWTWHLMTSTNGCPSMRNPSGGAPRGARGTETILSVSIDEKPVRRWASVNATTAVWHLQINRCDPSGGTPKGIAAYAAGRCGRLIDEKPVGGARVARFPGWMQCLECPSIRNPWAVPQNQATAIDSICPSMRNPSGGAPHSRCGREDELRCTCPSMRNSSGGAPDGIGGGVIDHM